MRVYPFITPTHDLLGRDFAPAAMPLDSAWVGDITYIRTWQLGVPGDGDRPRRRVVGFAVREHMRTELVSAALEMALMTRRPGPGSSSTPTGAPVHLE